MPWWPSLAGHRLGKLSFDERGVNWASFRDFLATTCSDRVATGRIRYARKFCHCLFNRDFSGLNTFSDSKRLHAMKALSALAKFLGLYGEFKDLIKNYGLKWNSGNVDDLIISRLTKDNENGDVLKWIGRIKDKLPKTSCVSRFCFGFGVTL